MTETDYDRVDYGGSAQILTAPNRLAGISRLLGVPCAAPRTARVLELACGNGANLVPLAWYWPDAEFVGIDLAQTPITQGRAFAQALGLRNLRLEQGDITALNPARLGSFDYVIAHGLFSWVPEPVREATLRLMAAVLSPVGIGYVSYNAYPGTRIRHLARELMQFHLGDHQHSIESTARAWGMLEAMDTIDPAQRSTFLDLLQEESVSARKNGMNFLFHDDLSPENQPFYLHEFARLAAAADLAYLGDAEVRSMAEPESAPTLTRWLDDVSAGDWLRRQQYLDFAIGTRFRRSLVCRRERAPNPSFQLSALDTLRICSDFRAMPGACLSDDSEVSFTEPGRRSISTNHPNLKTVLALFGASPTGTLGVDALAERLEGAPPEQARGAARSLLQRLILNNLAYPLADDPPGCSAASPPQAAIAPLSALSRALLDNRQPLVDNRHQSVRLEEPWLQDILQHLDGRHSAEQLAEIAARTSASPGRAVDPDEIANGLSGLFQMLQQRGLCRGGPLDRDPPGQPAAGG